MAFDLFKIYANQLDLFSKAYIRMYWLKQLHAIYLFSFASNLAWKRLMKKLIFVSLHSVNYISDYWVFD